MNKIGTWSDFVNPRFTQLKPGDQHPLGTITNTAGQPPDVQPPHVATGVMQNRRDFVNSFRPLKGDMFDNPKSPPNILDQMTQDIQNFSIQSNYKTNSFQNSNKFQNNSQMSQLRQMAAPNGPMTQNHAGLVKTWDNIEARNGVNPQTRSGLGYEAPQSVSGGSPDPVSQLVEVERENTKNAQGIKNAHDQEQINMDYQKNSMQKGIHAQQQAEMIKSQQQTQSNLENAYGAAGSIFGPVGAIIGNLIGNSQANKSDAYMKTAYSNQGKVNPQDTGVANTNSSLGATGETQQVNNF